MTSNPAQPPPPRTPLPLDHLRIPIHNLHPRLHGLTICHLSDLHVRRPRPRYHALARLLARLTPDLILLTGDYMSHPGDEPHALRVLQLLADHWQPRHAAAAVFGNHDSRALRDAATRRLPGVTFLHAGVLDLPQLHLRIVGVSSQEDWLAAAIADHDTPTPHPDTTRIAISHRPAVLPAVARARIPLLLAGHTHAGQIRLPAIHQRRPAFYAPHSSSDLPGFHAAGVLQLEATTCVISRGVGEQGLHLRLFAPPHIPLITLHRAEEPPTHDHRLRQHHHR